MSDVAAAPAAPVTAARDTAGLLVGAVVAAVAGVGLWAAARNAATVVVVVVAVLQAVLLVSWIVGMRVPGRVGGLVVCAAAAALADVLAVRYPVGQLGVLLPSLGLIVLAIFVAQLTRGVVRVRVVESVSDVALLGIAVIALGSLVQLRHGLDGDVQLEAVAAVVAAALVVASLVDMVAPFPRFDPLVDRGLLGVLLGGVAGAAFGYLTVHETFGYGPQRGLFLGGALGLVTTLVAVGAAFARFPRPGVVEAAATGAAVGSAAASASTVPAVTSVSSDVSAVSSDVSSDSSDDSSDSSDDSSDDAVGSDDVVIEADPVAPGPPSPWPDRLRPVATVLWALAICSPVGYLLTLALGG